MAEGVVTAEFDFAALRALWESADTPIRRQMPQEEAATLLAALYTQLRSLPRPTSMDLLGDSGGPFLDSTVLQSGASELTIGLDDLVVLATVTSRWPPAAAGDDGDSVERVETDLLEWPNPRAYGSAAENSLVRREDETDEMDAVEGSEPTETPVASDISDALETSETPDASPPDTSAGQES
jgi:hypothetical protein